MLNAKYVKRHSAGFYMDYRVKQCGVGDISVWFLNDEKQ